MAEKKQDKTDAGSSRRDFLKKSSLLVAAGGTVVGGSLSIARAAHSFGSDTIKIGLVGCGGRGTGAATQALNTMKKTDIQPNGQVKLIAMADAFADRLQGSYRSIYGAYPEHVDVPKERRFVGFDAYKQVLECDIDLVILATSPGFRPLHIEAAAKAGKHIFAEKPTGTDAAGIRRVLAANEIIKSKNLAIAIGLQRHHEKRYIETVNRIWDGAIGDIVTTRVYWNGGGVWVRPRNDQQSELEYQMRNWYYFNWLCGDHINEQHIHSLDKIGWVMGDVYPDRVTASGGRISRVDEKYGNIYDHFNSVYEWDNGVKAFSSCRQLNQTSTDVSDHIFGTEGTAHMQRHQIDYRNGKKWAHEQAGTDNMYQNEHDAFFKAIRSGNTINNGEYMCNSTLMAIMARMSAYTGKTVARDQALNSDLKLTPEKYEWGDHQASPIPRPGITEFV